MVGVYGCLWVRKPMRTRYEADIFGKPDARFHGARTVWRPDERRKDSTKVLPDRRKGVGGEADESELDRSFLGEWAMRTVGEIDLQRGRLSPGA